MKCAKAQELFSGYLEKTIQPPMGVAFEQHLAECAHCKAEYNRFHATTVVLDELPEVEPPPDMHAVIMARIERARREAPGKVRWLHFDWQSVFTVRVPARALAMGGAMLLVLAMLVQLTPLHTMTASILGGQRSSHSTLEDTGFAPGPLPSGVNTDAGIKFATLDGGLLMGIGVDSSSPSSTVYTVKLGSSTDSAVAVQVSLLPDGYLSNGIDSNNPTNTLYVGTVDSKHFARVPVVIAQPSSSRNAKVAMVTWKSEGVSRSEFVLMPSSFATVRKDAELSMSDAGASDILSRLSSDYGTVILAPADVVGKRASATVEIGSADEAMGNAMKQMGMTWQPLGPSVYEVK